MSTHGIEGLPVLVLVWLQGTEMLGKLQLVPVVLHTSIDGARDL